MRDTRLPSDPSFFPPHVNDKIANVFSLQRDCLERRFNRDVDHTSKLWNRTQGQQWSSLRVVDLATGMTVHEIARHSSTMTQSNSHDMGGCFDVVARAGYVLAGGDRVPVGIDRTDYRADRDRIHSPAAILVDVGLTPGDPVDHSRIVESGWGTGRANVVAVGAIGWGVTGDIGRHGLTLDPRGGGHYATFVEEDGVSNASVVIARYDHRGVLQASHVDDGYPLGIDNDSLPHSILADDSGVAVAGTTRMTTTPHGPPGQLRRFDRQCQLVGGVEVTVTGPASGGAPVGESFPVQHTAFAIHQSSGTITATNGGAEHWKIDWPTGSGQRTTYSPSMHSWTVRRYDTQLNVVAENTVADAADRDPSAVYVSPNLGATMVVDGATAHIYNDDLSGEIGSFPAGNIIPGPDWKLNNLPVEVDDGGNIYYITSATAKSLTPDGTVRWETPLASNVDRHDWFTFNGWTYDSAISIELGLVVFVGNWIGSYGTPRRFMSASAAAFRMSDGRLEWVRSLGDLPQFVQWDTTRGHPVRDSSGVVHRSVRAARIALADDGRHAFIATEAGFTPALHHSRPTGARVHEARQ